MTAPTVNNCCWRICSALREGDGHKSPGADRSRADALHTRHMLQLRANKASSPSSRHSAGKVRALRNDVVRLDDE